MLLIKNCELPNHKKLSLHIEKDTNLALHGNNGTGKSLTLKSIAFLIPTSFETFLYQNISIANYDLNLYRSEVFYLGSHGFSFGEKNIFDFLKAPLAFKAYQNGQSSFDIFPYLEEWKLTSEKLENLSSGQRQQLHFLRALSLKAKILLLDEFSSHVDHAKTLQMEAALQKWQEVTGGQYVLVSHEQQQIERLNCLAIPIEKLLKN